MNSISTPPIRSWHSWLLPILLLFASFQPSLLAAQQPTVTDFKIMRPGGAYYTTSFTPATASSDANATALEVPTNTFRINLEFSEAVTPTGGSNAKFDTKNEIADLLVLKLGSGAGPDLITPGTLASTASDINHSADDKTITVNLKLAVLLTTGNTYTLTLDTNKVALSADPTKKAKPFSAVFSTAKAVTILPAIPTTTICNSGNSRALPPIAINEQSVGSFAIGSGTFVLAFNHPAIKITKAPTVAVIGAPGDFLLPMATLTSDGKLRVVYNFTAFSETSGILLSGMEVASTSSTNLTGVQLRPESGFENFIGMDASTVLATIDAVNITSTGGPARPIKIDGFVTVCVGGSGFTYIAAPVAGVTGYHWKLPAGFTTTDSDATLIPANGEYHTPDNQITLAVATTTSPGNYTLAVKAANDCQVSLSARNKTIQVAPAPNPSVTLPARRFSNDEATPVVITVTNSPAGGVGTLRGDGVVNEKLYPNLLLPGKSYKVYYDYAINNCTATVEAPFEVYDPDALVAGLRSNYCADDNREKAVSVDDLATADSVKLYSPGNTLIRLPSRLIAAGTYQYRFTPLGLYAAYGAGTYRFEIVQSTLPGITNTTTFELREPPRQTISGPAMVCGDGSTIYNYASSVPGVSGDIYFWDVLSGNGVAVGGIDNGPQVAIRWNGGSTAGTKDTLQLTQIRNGCQTVTNYIVTVFLAPSPDIQGKVIVCPGETVTYTLDQPGGTYLWRIKDGEGGTIIGPTNEATVTVRWEKMGILEIVQTLNGCASSGSRFVDVENLPKITIAGLNSSTASTYCVNQTTPVKLTPVFDGLTAPPADYLTAGKFEIKRVSGNKPATSYMTLTQGVGTVTDQLVPAHPIQSTEAAINPDTLTHLINLGAGIYKIRYVYQDPTKRCPNYSAEYEIEIKPLPALTFTGLSQSIYCANDSPVVLSGFKNGVLTPVLPGFKVKNTVTGTITTLNGTLLEPSKLTEGNYELFLEFDGGSTATSECGNTSTRDTTVNFSIVAPPSNLRVIATRDFNQDTITFAIDTTGVSTSEFAQTSWNFGNLLASSRMVKYPVALGEQGKIASTNYTLMVQNKKGCATTITQNFQVDFSFEGHCLGMPTRFHDASLITGTSISSWQWDFGDGNTSNAQNPMHTYKAPGTYWIKLTIKSNPVAGHELAYTLRRRIDIFPVVIISTAVPYKEDFESASGTHWITHGVVDSSGILTDKSSWRLWEDQTNNNSAWVTDNENQRQGSNAQYFDLEQSYVESPCFEISELPRPMLSFRYKVDTDPGGDGVVLLYTIDDGANWYRLGTQNAGINWYNSKPVLGRPGSRFIKDGSNDDQQGWSGQDTAWRVARFSLDEVLRRINELGLSPQNKRVRFRFALGSNADNIPGRKLDGFAFDDFEIRSRNRQVLLEYFINESLDSATQKDLEAASFAQKNPEAISLHYHTDFPGPDTFNAANEKDPSGRTFFYGIRAVPRLIVDGENRDSLPNYSQAARHYSRRTLLPAPFELTILPPTIEEQNMLKFTTKLNVLVPFKRSVVVQVVIIDTLAQSKGTGANYSHVVRKMLPDAAGTFVAKRDWQQGDSLLIDLSWDVSSYPVPLDLSRLQVIVFVQDYLTKEVYQATAYRTTLPKRTSGAGEVTGITLRETPRPLLIFPNPATRDYATVLLPSALRGVPLYQIRWKVTDLQGRTLQQGHWASRSEQHVVFLDDLPSGTYLYRLYFQDQVFQGRLIKKE